MDLPELCHTLSAFTGAGTEGFFAQPCRFSGEPNRTLSQPEGRSVRGLIGAWTVSAGWSRSGSGPWIVQNP